MQIRKKKPESIKGHWQICTPKSVARFSAIGYIFGRRLHLVSGFPIGLIDASVGGTTVEAWTSRNKLKAVDGTEHLLEEWDQKISSYDAQESLNLVAMTVLLLKEMPGGSRITLEAGFYAFGVSVILSLLTAQWVEKKNKNPEAVSRA